jgi:hypothetical protein
MTNQQINYTIWTLLLVSAIGIPVVFLGDHGSVLSTSGFLLVCTVFTIPSWQRAK